MKLNAEQIKILTREASYISKWDAIRLGQSLMIALYDIDKDLYTEITGSDVDPFYDDSKIDKFLEYIMGSSQ